MSNNSYKLLMVMGITLLAGSNAEAAGTFVIGGPASNLAPASSTYSIDGSTLTAYRAAVTNAANFGPAGIVNTAVSFLPMSAITPAALSGVNAFMAPWWFSSDSSPYNQMVVNYFLAGGNLILLNDSTNQNGISSILGIPTIGQATGSAENGGAPIFAGAFGTATNVIQSAQIGFFTSANITAHGGTVCGTNADGQATVACFAAGAYAAGSGRLLIVNDVDTWTTQANFSPLNSNGIFALNGTAFIVNGGSGSTGTPSSAVPTLSEWGMAGLTLLLAASASLLMTRRRYQQ